MENNANGSTWVFVRSGGGWIQQSRLVGTGNIGPAQQGSSVSVSSDGNKLIIGGPKDNDFLTSPGGTGAAWIFNRTGTTWTQEGNKLVGANTVGEYAGSQQGFSVAISADGATSLLGGPVDNIIVGAAWVFSLSGSTWTEQAKLLPASSPGPANQGYSVSVSADGNTLIVGGPNDNGGYPGAAWIFTRSGTNWSQQGTKLVGSGAAIGQTNQGYSVSISADGNTAVVGARGDNNTPGAAWVFIPFWRNMEPAGK